MARQKQPEQGTEQVTPETTVKGLDLSMFNYKDLKGESFKSYNEVVAGLQWNKKYDFEVYKVEPVFKMRYPGMEKSPRDVVGIRLVKDEPVKTARLEVRHVHDFNGKIHADGDFFTVVGGQWHNGNGGNSAYYGQYYLLKK